MFGIFDQLFDFDGDRKLDDLEPAIGFSMIQEWGRWKRDKQYDSDFDSDIFDEGDF